MTQVENFTHTKLWNHSGAHSMQLFRLFQNVNSEILNSSPQFTDSKPCTNLQRGAHFGEGRTYSLNWQLFMFLPSVSFVVQGRGHHFLCSSDHYISIINAANHWILSTTLLFQVIYIQFLTRVYWWIITFENHMWNDKTSSSIQNQSQIDRSFEFHKIIFWKIK